MKSSPFRDNSDKGIPQNGARDRQTKQGKKLKMFARCIASLLTSLVTLQISPCVRVECYLSVYVSEKGLLNETTVDGHGKTNLCG